MTLTERFLKAKHWQLFVLMFGIPMGFQFVMMGTMLTTVANGTEPDSLIIFRFVYVFPVLMVVFVGTFFGWFWSIAIGLQSRIPANVKMKTGKFKVFFIIPIVYMLLISIAVGITMSGFPALVDKGDEPNIGLVLGSIGVIVPLYLFSMFCIFYCLYFVSKTLKTVELQRETTFSDFAVSFSSYSFTQLESG